MQLFRMQILLNILQLGISIDVKLLWLNYVSFFNLKDIGNFLSLVSSINGSTTTSQESQLPLTSNTIMPSNVFAVPTQNQFNFCRPVLPPTQNFENGTNVNLTNYNKNVSRAESITYYRTLFKHFVIYSNQLLPALFSIFTSFQKQKMIVDFQKQANCMLDLCNHVVSLFPNSGTTIQKNSFKIFRKLAKVNLIGELIFNYN